MRNSMLAIVFVLAGAWGVQAAEPCTPVSDASGRADEPAVDGSFQVTILREDVPVKTGSGMPVPAGTGPNPVFGQHGGVLFTHVAGEGVAQELARTVRAAWDTRAVSRSGPV